MQFLIDRRRLVIVPDTEQDIAFIEDTLGLRHDGDTIFLDRLKGTDVGVYNEDRYATISSMCLVTRRAGEG